MPRPYLTSAIVAAASLGAGVAVPLVELHLLRRRNRPELPAHRADGIVGPTAGARRVVFLGDSLAAGVGASGPTGALPHQVARLLGGGVDLQVLARPGARIGDVVDEQLPALRAALDTTDLVVVSVGANDVSNLTRRRDFQRAYDTLLAAIGPVPVAALSVPDMGSALVMAQPLRWIAGLRARMVDAWISRVVARHDHVRRVDIATRPSHARPVRRYLADDLYHPNDHGYREWARCVADAIVGWVPAFTATSARP